MTIAGVTRELLVRYLDTWTPAALHAGKRATFVLAGTDLGADDALRVFAEFDDLLRTRTLTFVVLSPSSWSSSMPAGSLPAGLIVHALIGSADDLLDAALAAAGAAGAPLLVCAQSDSPPVRAAKAGRPVELLSLLPAGTWPAQRSALIEAGFPLTAGVELVGTGASLIASPAGESLVASGAGESLVASGELLVAFASGKANSLEAFKNALWSVDEYAGVRYRDPTDPDGHLLDISLDPHPGPLRRALLGRLAEGPLTVTELKRFTMTETIYRPADATRVLSALLHAGAVATNTGQSRLAGDVTLRRAA
jgi:hypothetical protein